MKLGTHGRSISPWNRRRPGAARAAAATAAGAATDGFKARETERRWIERDSSRARLVFHSPRASSLTEDGCSKHHKGGPFEAVAQTYFLL